MRNIFKALPVVLIVGLLIVQPGVSYADWHGDRGHDHGRDHDHGDWHHHDDDGWHRHSYVGVDFSVWPNNYYYDAPYYPPVDTVYVSQPVAVVQQPVEVIQPPPVIDHQAEMAPADDTFIINIPNEKGGYTAVTLKKSGNGFTGPQGEFYAEFPKVSQLKVIYGK